MMPTIDGYITDSKGVHTFALVSVRQRDHYGSYAEAIRALGVEMILSPALLDPDDYDDLPFFYEVGHA